MGIRISTQTSILESIDFKGDAGGNPPARICIGIIASVAKCSTVPGETERVKGSCRGVLDDKCDTVRAGASPKLPEKDAQAEARRLAPKRLTAVVAAFAVFPSPE